MSNWFEIAIHAVHEIDACETPGEALEAAARFGASVGLEVAAVAEFAGTLTSQRSVVSSFPSEWAARYFVKKYEHLDPVVASIRKHPSESVNWGELRAQLPRRSIAKRILAEGAEFGLVDGITIPVLGNDGHLSGFSFAGEAMPDDPQVISALKLVGVYAHARIAALGAPDPPKQALTLREIEALQWAAAGRTDSQMASEMNITSSTAHRHIENAKAKLGASSRLEAVMLATKLRLLYVD